MYRIWQFWKSITARLSPADWAEIGQILTSPQLELFRALPPSDRAHSFRVMKTLIQRGFQDQQLLAAALLHDAGKSQHPLRFWERPIPVLVERFFPGASTVFLDYPPRGWRRALVVACQHPEWGAELAAGAGASPLTVWLIRNHQQTEPEPHPHPRAVEFLAVLQETDSQN